MQQYHVTGRSADFFPGTVLALSDEQFKTRTHALKRLKQKGVYEVTAPVQFKKGEEIGIPGEISKALLEVLSPVKVAGMGSNQETTTA